MLPRSAWNIMVLLACTLGKGTVVRGAFRTASRNIVRGRRPRPAQAAFFDARRVGYITRSAKERASISMEASRPSVDSPVIELRIPTSEMMEELGGLLYSVIDVETTTTRSRRSSPLSASAVICLDGDLGAGKTAFSRGFVRAATGDWSLRVTSPTYLLSNAYRTSRHEIHHMDLYRLGSTDDLSPLNLAHVFRNCVALIEWPERVSVLLPEDRLDVHLTILPAEPSDDDSSLSRSEDGDDGDVDPNAPRTIVLRPRGDLWTGRILQLVKDGSLDDLLL